MIQTPTSSVVAALTIHKHIGTKDRYHAFNDRPGADDSCEQGMIRSRVLRRLRSAFEYLKEKETTLTRHIEGILKSWQRPRAI